MSRPGRARPVPAPSAAPAGVGVDSAPVVLAALGACLALRVLASLASSNWLWGLDTLRGWPIPAMVALVLVGAAGFVPPVARAITGALERLGAAWGARRALGDALAVAIVCTIVFTLRDPVLFVGDSSLRAGALSLDVPMSRLFPQAFPLDLGLNIHLPRELARHGPGILTAIQMVGAMMAGLFTLAALAFLRSIGARGASLAAGALLLLGGGYVVHFAGYDKYGPLLVGIALAAAGAAALERERGGAWMLAAGTVVCILATRIGYAILPPALMAFALAWRRRSGRATVAVAAALTLLVALVMLPHTIEILRTIDRPAHMPGGTVARTLASAGAPVLLLRFADTLNLLFLLAPLWPVGVIAVLGLRRTRVPAGGAGLGAVAALAVAIQLAIPIAFRGPQGMTRDWDAYVGVGLVATLATTWALVSSWLAAGATGAGGRARRAGSSPADPTIAPAVTVTLIGAAALWGLHANESLSLRRIEAQLTGHPRWSETARAAAYDNLGLRALRLARFDESARHFESAFAVAPNPRFRYQAGLAYLGAMRLDRAEEALRASIPYYRTSPDPWIGLARVALARGDSVGVGAYLDSALTRDPRNAEAADIRRALTRASGTP